MKQLGALVVAVLLAGGMVCAQTPEADRLASLEKQIAALVSANQAAQKEIAALKAPKADVPKPEEVRENYQKVCTARGLKFQGVDIHRDGTKVVEVIKCR